LARDFSSAYDPGLPHSARMVDHSIVEPVTLFSSIEAICFDRPAAVKTPLVNAP
jgi:hypothetical protein